MAASARGNRPAGRQWEAVKVHVNLPAAHVQVVDAVAKRRYLDRSAVIREAVRAYVEQVQGDQSA